MERNDVIRVLGPIDVVIGGEVRSIGGVNARRLLGALVVGAGRAVASDRLEWSLWGEARPESATASLHTYVARLRRLLGHGCIEREDHSYRLAVEREQVDAIRFEDLLVHATDQRDDPDRCRATCLDALHLWRGDPFGDFVDDEPFRLESARLGELRVTAMELELECELALGHPEIVAAELESAVEEFPYRERLWYLLIEARMRDDRRVEALRACHRLRALLADTGLQPGEHLLELERTIVGAGDAPAGGGAGAP